MQKTFTQLIIATAALAFFFAVGVGAYNNPTATAPNNDAYGPIDQSGENQIKSGGLSVNAFLSTANALFSQDMFIKGMIRGADATNSTVSIGGSSNEVNAAISGNFVQTNGAITSSALAHSGGLEPLCADGSGNLIICPAPPPLPVQLTFQCFSFSGGGCSGQFQNVSTGQTYTIVANNDGNADPLVVPAGTYEWLGGTINNMNGCPGYPGYEIIDIDPAVGTQKEIGDAPLPNQFDATLGCH